MGLVGSSLRTDNPKSMCTSRRLVSTLASTVAALAALGHYYYTYNVGLASRTHACTHVHVCDIDSGSTVGHAYVHCACMHYT